MSDKQFWRLLAFIAVVYLLGSTVDIMDIDASQYAAMSREMLESGSYLQVYEHGKDYLDKPPLIFWLSSWSMKLFGVGNFGYKFPSFLFALLAIYSTYRFAQLFYSENIAKLAALILASTQALFLITNDCRTDTLLIGAVSFTFWQLAAAFLSQKWTHFLWGFVGIGVGMLAKGPIALILPCMGFGTHFIIKKEFKNFLRIEYLWGVVVIGLVLLPMCIGLYQQFDMHPEKVVNEKTGTSGLRFFFWTQSFGRITGENVWRNDAYFTFLFETMLWSFAPWILYFILDLGITFVNLFRKEPILTSLSNQEYISFGAVILGYISLASSKYQLPHYIFVIYPMAAVMTARVVDALMFKNTVTQSVVAQDALKGVGAKVLNIVQWVIVALLVILPFAVLSYIFPANNLMWGSVSVSVGLLAFSIIRHRHLFLATVQAVTVLNIFISLYFYNELLEYQEGSVVGKYIHKTGVEKGKFFTYKYPVTSSLQFYAQRIIQEKDSVNEVAIGDWLLTDEKGVAELQNAHWDVKFEETGNVFPVALMTPEFVNAQTRDNTLGQYFLVKIQGIVQPEPVEEQQPNQESND